MPLITQSIPNLVGGVSQQPPAVRSSNQCEEMVNAFPSVVEGLVKRPPTEKVSEIRNAANDLIALSGPTVAKPHMIVRDLTEKYLCTVLPNATAANCDISVYDLDGTKKTVYFDSGSKDYLAGASRDTLKLLTIADVTFILNTAKTVTMDAAKTTAINYERIALVYIKQSGADREIEITVSDTDGTDVVTVSHKTSSSSVGTDHAAEALASSLNGAGPAGFTYTATSSDSVIKITRGSDFKITVDDDFGGQGAFLIRDVVQRFEDLPPCAPNNHVVKVIGAPESNLDDYYVKFEAENGDFSKGIWRETVAPDIEYLLSYGTMPHILIRQSNGTFMFKKADGTTPASNVPAGASYAAYKWGSRNVGDDATNSEPSFVDTTISNMVLFKNRLGFLSNENIVLSEVSEFFNFWRTTVLDLPDSEPIDIASSSPKIAKLKSGVVFNTELLLFTESSQLVLRGGEILSPKSVSLLPVGDYESYADIQPVSSGLSVFFTYNRGGGWAGAREIVPQPNIDGSYVVNTLSETIPNYIPTKPTSIASTTQEDLMAVVSGGDLYLYKYLRQGGESVISSWFKYTFPDTRTAGKATVIWADFVDAYLYVLLLRNDSNHLVLEKMRIGTSLTDEATVNTSNWVTHLDSRAYFASGTGTYSSSTGLTTWNLPKPLSYAAGKILVYTTAGTKATVTSGTAYNGTTDVAGTVAVTGDYSAKAVWIGLKYEMLYKFSQLWLPSRTGVSSARVGQSAMLTGRFQLRNMSLLYEDTAFFKVTVGSGGENTYSYVYSGTIAGLSEAGQISLERGTFRFPIFGRNTTTEITITNDTALPCKLVSAEVEAEYTARSQRYS